ncbi:MAG: DUF1223 domain-containing protein, partial [Bacteroidota bacterium]
VMSRPSHLRFPALLALSAFFIMCSFAPEETSQALTSEPAPIQTVEHPVLVELFTSQGCSSCPPADRVLQALDTDAQSGDAAIITLSYHVDYWNRLGWRDPYSQSAFSDRQRDYARHLNDRGVYTPQAVINGRTGHIGSRERELRSAIQTASTKAPQLQIAGNTSWTKNNEITVDYQLSTLPENAVLQVAVVQAAVENEVPRGENRGRHLAHTNVVRQLTTVSPTQTEGQSTISLESEVVRAKSDLHLVLFVESTRNMQVLGVARADL